MTSTDPTTEHRVAIVTAASRGIRAAIAHELAAQPYRLGLISRSTRSLQGLAGRGTLQGIQVGTCHR